MTTAILKETFPIFPVAMRSFMPILLLLPVLGGNPTVAAQSRIPFNGRQLFVSGSNVAWVNFAADIGPGATDPETFRDMFDSIHSAGGNAMRFWLHTNGAATPEFNSTGLVTGPGAGAIADLKSILDAAHDRKVGWYPGGRLSYDRMGSGGSVGRVPVQDGSGRAGSRRRVLCGYTEDPCGALR